MTWSLKTRVPKISETFDIRSPHVDVSRAMSDASRHGPKTPKGSCALLHRILHIIPAAEERTPECADYPNADVEPVPAALPPWAAVPPAGMPGNVPPFKTMMKKATA